MHSISLSTFPLFLSKSAYAALHLFLYFKLLWRQPYFAKASKGILRSYSFNIHIKHLRSWLAIRSSVGAKYGGERGIRTLDAPFETYMISNHAPSTTQTPLRWSININLYVKNQFCKTTLTL
jgi:hypothetical protein